MPYLATINVPGYLPMDDAPPVFETAQEAWEYLAQEREYSCDSPHGPGCPWGEAQEYSETRETLAVLGELAHWRHTEVFELAQSNGLGPDGSGTVYGDSPGYHGSHDLVLAYSVTYIESEDES